MTKRRVVVTGLGAVTPIGNNVRNLWESIESSHSGITKITKFDASNYASQIAGEVKGFNAADHLNVKDVRRTDTFFHFGLVAGCSVPGNHSGSYIIHRVLPQYLVTYRLVFSV